MRIGHIIANWRVQWCRCAAAVHARYVFLSNFSHSKFLVTVNEQRQPLLGALPVTGSGRREHITPTLKRLHWLPVKHRIDYKIAAVTFKVRQTGEPAYLNSLITAYIQRVH